MADRIRFRRGTAAEWTRSDPVLHGGEPGYETDSGRQKIGNGVDPWSVLPYFHDERSFEGSPASPSLSGTFIDIRDPAYGARGDGTTDDTLAIAKAIRAATTQNAQVLVPPGTYLVSQQSSSPTDVTMQRVFVLDAHVEIVGAGPGSVIKVEDETSTTLFWIEGATAGGRISGLSMMGSGIASPHRSSAIRLVASRDWEIDHNVIERWGSHNVLVRDGSERNRVHHNLIRDSVMWNGVEIINCARNEVSHNTILNSNDQGIEVRASTDNLIAYNVIVDSGLGAPAGPNSGIGLEHGAHRNLVTGNRIYRSQQSAIQVIGDCADNLISDNTCEGTVEATDLISVLLMQGITLEVTQPRRNQIIGNVLTGAKRDGIQVRGAPDTILADNKIGDCARRGITVESFQLPVLGSLTRFSATDCILRGNEVHSCGATGIDVSYGDSVIIAGNKVSAPASDDPVAAGVDGIRVINTSNLLLMGNRVSGHRYGVRAAALNGGRFVGNETAGNLRGPALVDTSTGLSAFESGSATLDGALRLGDGSDIVLGAGRGSKIGTATTQKIGFFNAAPVARPEATPPEATDLATALTLVNDLRAKLLRLGLIG